MLSLSGATVTGNVQIAGGTFSIGPSTTIKGNFTASNLPASSTQSLICGATVQGNVVFQNNGTAVQIGSATPASCAGNTFGSDLQVQNNTAATTIIGNTVKGNLQDQNNTGATQVSNNAVTNDLQCGGNTTITGSGNTAAQKQGQCASF